MSGEHTVMPDLELVARLRAHADALDQGPGWHGVNVSMAITLLQEAADALERHVPATEELHGLRRRLSLAPLMLEGQHREEMVNLAADDPALREMVDAVLAQDTRMLRVIARLCRDHTHAKREDTIGVLMISGVFHELPEGGLLKLAERVDSVDPRVLPS